MERGQVETDDGTANAFTVTLDRNGVLIENAIYVDYPSYRHTHGEFRRALEQVIEARDARAG